MRRVVSGMNIDEYYCSGSGRRPGRIRVLMRTSKRAFLTYFQHDKSFLAQYNGAIKPGLENTYPVYSKFNARLTTVTSTLGPSRSSVFTNAAQYAAARLQMLAATHC